MNSIVSPSLPCRSHKQVDDLRLDRHVERTDRLVTDEKVRARGERPRQHGALALSAGQFAGITAPVFGRQIHRAEQLERHLVAFGARRRCRECPAAREPAREWSGGGRARRADPDRSSAPARVGPPGIRRQSRAKPHRRISLRPHPRSRSRAPDVPWSICPTRTCRRGPGPLPCAISNDTSSTAQTFVARPKKPRRVT